MAKNMMVNMKKEIPWIIQDNMVRKKESMVRKL
jgi:hypothetical protein